MSSICTESAPAAIGPYTQGVDLGSMVITSGQLPINPETGSMSEDVGQQTTQSLNNALAIIKQAGLEVKNIVKTTVFVKDLHQFAQINSAYEAFFASQNAPFPARSCVEVARLPLDAQVEIEVIATR